MIIDDSGNVIKMKIIPLDTNEIIYDAQFISNNKIILVTNLIIGSPVTNFYSKLRVIDTSGSTLTSKLLNFSPYVRLNTILTTNNNDFIFTGSAEYNSTYSDFYAIRTDSNLNFPPIHIINISNKIPNELYLYQNYPNPFNNSTRIQFDINKADNYSLIIYDVLGRQLDILLNKYLTAGKYSINYSNNLASGVYIYQLKSKTENISKMMVILK